MKEDKQVDTISTIAEKPAQQNNKGQLVQSEERAKGHVNFSIYKSYIESAGGYWFFAFILSCFIFAEILKALSSYWLTLWGDSHGGMCLFVYCYSFS